MVLSRRGQVVLHDRGHRHRGVVAMSKIVDEVAFTNISNVASLALKDALARPRTRRVAIAASADSRLASAKYIGPSEGDARVDHNAGGRAAE
jgi:carbonic anhydrase